MSPRDIQYSDNPLDGTLPVHPTVFRAGVYSERVRLRDNAQNENVVDDRYMWYPRLDVVGVKSAKLHTRWIVPKQKVPMPIGFKFPTISNRTFKLGRANLVDG